MKKNGTGGANTNAHGLLFEAKMSLESAMKKAGFSFKPRAGYVAKANVPKDVYSPTGDFVGVYFKKAAFSTFIETEFGVKVSDVLSKGLQPDDGFWNPSTRKIIIEEQKWQSTQGSVDEKIQTGPFKLHQYTRVAKACGDADGKPISAAYGYVLSPWFKADAYRDVIEFNRGYGIPCYFDTLPLEFLGL